MLLKILLQPLMGGHRLHQAGLTFFERLTKQVIAEGVWCLHLQ